MAHITLHGTETRRVVSPQAEDLMVLPLRDQTWPDDAFLDLRGPEF
jgi:hypothetical protein